jgi:hypothetical protein
MRNLLTLHEAVAFILIGQPIRAATFQTIANKIEKRHLFPIRKGRITLAKKIELRTVLKTSKYRHLFEFIKPDKIRLL